MKSEQPVWKFLANLGDADPLDHGGFFVYIDETGKYPPEVEVVERDDESGDPHYSIYRFALEPCTFINGILSDNKFHPGKPAWFAKPESERVERPQDTTYFQNLTALCDPMTDEELAAGFCSDDPLKRAEAWRLVGMYHGYDNLDSYPLKMRRRELRQRYLERNGVKYR